LGKEGRLSDGVSVEAKGTVDVLADAGAFAMPWRAVSCETSTNGESGCEAMKAGVDVGFETALGFGRV
jgi:hypothetical protein